MIKFDSLKTIDKEKPVIAHGAGKLAAFYVTHLETVGISPVCFTDRDKGKHNSKICGRIVLSVKEAIQKYPDAYFYITAYFDSEKIAEDLVLNYGIKKENILNFIIHRKKINCRYIEGNLNITSDFLCPCCMYPNNPFKTKIRDNDIKGTISDYLKQRRTALEIINSGEERDFCVDCAYLSETYDRSFGDIKFSTINCDFIGICNFECIYCGRTNNSSNKDNISRPDYLSSILRSLEEIKAIDDTTSLNFANDEITVNPFQNEFFNAAKNYVSVVFTNASVYSENIVKASKIKENFRLIVSNDSGTRGTFEKIKGRDVYDRVCQNLKKYADEGVKIHMKYIFIPDINDNQKDTDGFVDICEFIKCKEVYIDKEGQRYELKSDFPTQTIDVIADMISKLEKLDIRVALGNYLTENDRKALSVFFK